MAAGTATPFSSADRLESLSDRPRSHAAAPPPYPDGRSQRSQARVGVGAGWGCTAQDSSQVSVWRCFLSHVCLSSAGL